MIVTESELSSVIDYLMTKPILALDTETTGLHAFKGDKLFSLIIFDGERGFYFNFNDMNANDADKGIIPLKRDLLKLFTPLFSKINIRWILANAKFDMHMLAREGLFLVGEVWDILVMARIERNDFFQYSLAHVSARIGLKKSSAVDDYIKKYRCYKKERVAGKKGERKNPQFWMVPLEIIAPYGLTDAEITFKIYLHQMSFFLDWEIKNNNGVTSIWKVVMNEVALTKVCFNIERRGMLLDLEYVERALQYENGRAQKAMEAFQEASGGVGLVDSHSNLKRTFTSLGIVGGVTEKGNASFTDEILSQIDHPAVKALLEFRDANKRASGYYSSFIYFIDRDGVIHCNIKQSATTTSRFAITDPALQTLNNEEADDNGNYETEWRVRKAFVPRKNYCLISIDFKAFEFRAMLDTAGERDLANAIAGGLDPHTATAQLVGCTRKEAKAINFGLLFGMGAGLLATILGCSLDEAKRLKRVYFQKLPFVCQLMRTATYTAESKQRVISRFGRPYFFIDPKFAYKALNALIQGGTADAIKHAMVEIDKLLDGKKSGMLLQVHDELIFEIHESELYLIEPIKAIMEASWPEKFHKMECSVEHSWKSWGELEEGMPIAA